MSDDLDRDRIADLAEEILDLVDDEDEPGTPGTLAPPSGFATTWDRKTRRARSRWVDAPGAVATQIHESEKDPADTLKATVPAGVQERTSSELAGGRYRWAARSVGPDGELSDWTEWVVTDVPRDGESDDEDDDEPEDPPAGGGGPHPSDVLPVLRDWTIMLPTGSPGDPDNLYLVGKSIPGTYFVRDDEHGRGVVFRVHPGTANHSKGSKYGRAEGRQMVPGKPWEKSGWPSGTEKAQAEPQRLRARLRIDASHLAHPIVNAVQIHDGGDDVMQLQSRDGVLGIAHKDGDAWEVIDPDYGTAGEPFEVQVETTGRGEIVVHYEGAEAVRIEKTGSGWYWKTGSYPNTGGANDKRPEDPDAACEVVVYALEVDPA